MDLLLAWVEGAVRMHSYVVFFMLKVYFKLEARVLRFILFMDLLFGILYWVKMHDLELLGYRILIFVFGNLWIWADEKYREKCKSQEENI